LLFRNFRVRSVATFSSVVDTMAVDKMDYTYRSTPREAVGERIFTATGYPADREIPLHNENAYQRRWPLKLAFACLQAASSGGETPLADMQRVSARIGADTMQEFEARGVRYIRHYRPGIDLSWQTVFRVDEPAGVAAFCAENDILHEWLDEETLRTVQSCQGVARHPRTAESVFFNQAHLFHVSSMGEESARHLVEVFGRDRLPRHATYADGAEIEITQLEAIRSSFRAEASAFSWQDGDVLLLDNMQVAHGRRPYRGVREVLTALLDPSPPVRSP
jgi:alpha-ketoglutarate-dependent taurine dioxygenase